MAATEEFRHEQRGVALRMVAALCVTILVSAACLHWVHETPRPLEERLIVTAGADVFVISWLAGAIANVARLRFFSAEDIDGSASGIATAEVCGANAILQNTRTSRSGDPGACRAGSAGCIVGPADCGARGTFRDWATSVLARLCERCGGTRAWVRVDLLSESRRADDRHCCGSAAGDTRRLAASNCLTRYTSRAILDRGRHDDSHVQMGHGDPDYRSAVLVHEDYRWSFEHRNS